MSRAIAIDSARSASKLSPQVTPGCVDDSIAVLIPALSMSSIAFAGVQFISA